MTDATTYQARTAYDVPILIQTFRDRTHALLWAEHTGQHVFPGCKVVEFRDDRPARTIWRDKPPVVAADNVTPLRRTS